MSFYSVTIEDDTPGAGLVVIVHVEAADAYTALHHALRHVIQDGQRNTVHVTVVEEQTIESEASAR